MKKKECRLIRPTFRPSALELIAQQEQSEQISAALVGIAAEYREAIVLRFPGRTGAGRDCSGHRRAARHGQITALSRIKRTPAAAERSASVNRDPHQQGRELIACGSQDLTDSQQTWLPAHLDGCASCRDYAQAAEQFVRSLRSVPVAADLTLVRTTQMRVRLHAGQLRQKQERLWFVCVSCILVGLSAAVTTPLLWRGFEWIGGWAQVSSPVWQVGFMVFWISPALAVSLIFLARGIHLTDANGTSRG